MTCSQGASLRDRTTRASPEPASSLSHSASVPSAKKLYRERVLRALHLPGLSEPAFYMLLDLYANTGRQISVTSTCLAAFVPITTGLRYIGDLERDGLIASGRGDGDRRLRYLYLTPHGADLIGGYLNAIAAEAR